MTERRTSFVAQLFPREGRSFPKQCSCGAIYEESDWDMLPFYGIALGRDDSTGRNFGQDLEIRVCTCGSSMGQYVKDNDTQELSVREYEMR